MGKSLETEDAEKEDTALKDEEKAEKKHKDGKKRHPVRHTLFCLFLGFVIGVVVCVTKPWNMDLEEASEDVTMPEDAATIEYTTEETQNYVTVGTLQAIVKKASDLITTKYHYQDACSQVSAKEFDKLDITIPFTTSKVVFTYKGCISLGVDLSKVTYDIDNDNMVITVSLPDPGVIANEIDDTSFEIVDESESPFNPQQLDDYATLMAELKEEKEAEVLVDEELMAEVETNTQEVIGDFITSSSEAADYTVKFE